MRGFAAAGSAPKPAAKRRHSQLKLYSVRNSKLRSNFEQVWPTLRLTDEEAMLFKRNSRVFLTDMGKSIPLTTKFELAKATQEKVPHQDARSLLYESDLHLDAVGEHPRFLKIRRLRTQYATKLQSLRKLRVLMGFARRYMLQELYELSLTQPGPDRVWKFICAMESKLPNTVLRMGLAPDILAAKSHVSNAAVAVNGCREPMPHACHIQPADVVGPSESSHDWFKGYMASHIGKDMRNAVSRSWGFGGGGGNLSGPRMREALQAFGEAEQASGNSSNPHNTQ